MLPAAFSTDIDVLQFLHSDWQTVSALASDICAPDTHSLPGGDLAVLTVRLCARLYALSHIETELLYPCVKDDALRNSGSLLHDQMVVNLHAVLDAMMSQDSAAPSVHVLARDMGCLHQFEMDAIYPRCDPTSVRQIAERMVRRRIELLDRFTER